MVRKIWRIFRWFLLLLVVYIGGMLLFGTVNDYQPEAILPADCLAANVPTAPLQDSVFSALIWNVGYGGLGDEAEFFFDNGGFWFSSGEMIRSDEDDVDRYVAGALQTLQSTKVDFYLLQEVDRRSKRSYYRNQLAEYQEVLKAASVCFTPNYKTEYVPIPVLEPWHQYGQVLSGLATYANYVPSESERQQLPGEFPWPTKIFQLDRCLLTQEFPLANGKSLFVINVHLSAYDSGGELKAQQMQFLKTHLESLYADGHYVLVGGDWNQCPPNFPFDRFAQGGDTQGYSQINIASDWIGADWQWVYDPAVATNRKLKDPYEKDVTFTTIIDFYLLSPNLRATAVRTINQEFQFSDHQPVYVEVELL